MSQKHKGAITQKLLHKSIFQLSVKSDPGLHHLCFTLVCDYKTKIDHDLFASEFLHFQYFTCFTLSSYWLLITSTFVPIDCCDYMALDFRQQLKNALKNVEMSWGSKWERGGLGGRGGYTLLYLRDLTQGLLRKILYCPAFTFSTFCRLILNMWLRTLVMIRGLVGGTHDKVEGHVEIEMEAWGKYNWWGVLG